MKYLPPGLVLPLALCMTLTACNLLIDDSDDPLEPSVYVGLYSQGIEDSVFRPCDRDENWMLVADDSTFTVFIQQMAAVQFENPTYVRLRGTPSQRETYKGFFMTYDRRFTMTDVVEVRRPQEEDCS